MKEHKTLVSRKKLVIIVLVVLLVAAAGIFLAVRPGLGETGGEDGYVDRITETGSGLAREVEACTDIIDWRKTEYESLNDLRWYDCNNLKPEEKEEVREALPDVSFNEDTVFTEDISDALQPEVLLEKGKDPGLGVRKLHEQGITGKNVGIAIIDQGLYTGHPEYASRMKLYEEMHVFPEEEASMHGAALASIAAGKSCGVAPEADLYYWAFNNILDYSKQEFDTEDIDWNGYARVIDRVIEVNETLPEEKKIRVIAIARGYSFTGEEETDKRIQNMLDAIGRAEEAGIFVVTTSTNMNYDFLSPEGSAIAGLGKIDPAGDTDDVSNYTLGDWQWEMAEYYENSLLVPMDDRAVADMSGDTYVFYADGGWSWTVPYVAGMYALCAQVNPDITPKEFFHKAMETSIEIERSREPEGEKYTFHVLNPQALTESFH